MKSLLVAALVSFACIKARAEISVSIDGPVETRPSGKTRIVLPDKSTVLDVLAAAGGFGANAGAKVLIKRGAQLYTIDCAASLRGHPDAAFVLLDGDAVSVPESMMGLPHFDYFNRLLFEWAYLKSVGRKVDLRWKAQAALLTDSAQKKQ